ncbi:hypothetical protein [uncultured Nostoc sp.]|uniref:hypothetical protein n=1 Tax=uncultured Nostoc sp. TaxID=340711 RepID=UPI0035C98B14
MIQDVQLRGSDEKMVEFKALALKHRHVIKNYLNVSISEGLTPIAIAQKLLDKIDLKLDYVGRLGSRDNRECVYQFVIPDDERDLIFERWLNRDEAFVLASAQNAVSDSVSGTNNIVLTTPVIDTTSQLIPKSTSVVSGTNNIDIATSAIDTTSQILEEVVSSSQFLGWKGLMLKIRQGLDSAGSFYQELVSTIGSAVGVADGEPYWNRCLGQWQVWVSFTDGCKSVVCDWLKAA